MGRGAAMRHVIIVLGILPVLMGCAATGPAITGLATAGVAGTVGSATGSALAGAAVGLAVSYGVDQGVKYEERHIQGHVQDAIARTAGPLEPGQSAPWKVAEWLPLSDNAGTVEVARSFGEAIPCKEVVFSIAGDKHHRVFATIVCRNDEGEWMWAEADPSIYRWGYLQ
jgi:hypothetical protein